MLAASQRLVLFSDQFGPRSIDRIIGVSLRLGGLAGAASFVFQDEASGFVFPVQASVHLGNYTFNIETLPDNSLISFTPSVAIPASANFNWSLYNFEIPPSVIGQAG